MAKARPQPFFQDYIAWWCGELRLRNSDYSAALACALSPTMCYFSCARAESPGVFDEYG
jgi:hypothetical protein